MVSCRQTSTISVFASGFTQDTRQHYLVLLMSCPERTARPLLMFVWCLCWQSLSRTFFSPLYCTVEEIDLSGIVAAAMSCVAPLVLRSSCNEIGHERRSQCQREGEIEGQGGEHEAIVLDGERNRFSQVTIPYFGGHFDPT